MPFLPEPAPGVRLGKSPVVQQAHFFKTPNRFVRYFVRIRLLQPAANLGDRTIAIRHIAQGDGARLPYHIPAHHSLLFACAKRFPFRQPEFQRHVLVQGERKAVVDMDRNAVGRPLYRPQRRNAPRLKVDVDLFCHGNPLFEPCATAAARPTPRPDPPEHARNRPKPPQKRLCRP